MRATKGILIAFGTTLSVAVLLGLASPCSRTALAISGCCMLKSQSGFWERTDKSLQECKDLNDQLDEGDPLFEQSRSVWWDLSCS